MGHDSDLSLLAFDLTRISRDSALTCLALTCAAAWAAGVARAADPRRPRRPRGPPPPPPSGLPRPASLQPRPWPHQPRPWPHRHTPRYAHEGGAPAAAVSCWSCLGCAGLGTVLGLCPGLCGRAKRGHPEAGCGAADVGVCRVAPRPLDGLGAPSPPRCRVGVRQPCITGAAAAGGVGIFGSLILCVMKDRN